MNDRSPQARRTAVQEGLVLRGLLLALLPGAAGRARLSDGLTRASTTAWTVVLNADSCALPVAAHLRSNGLLDALPHAIRETLRDAESRESQRVLAARMTLLELEVVARELGIPLTVIKGGALIADRSAAPLDLGDIDALASTDDATRLWDALRARGWRPKTSTLAPAEAEGRNHFDPLLPPGEALPVELHQQVRYGAGDPGPESLHSAPIPGWAALRRLVGASGFLLVLRHSVVQHPHRRGHLRDLFLLARELRALDLAERAEVDARLRGERYEIELRSMLAQATALAAGTLVPDPIETRRFVAYKYASYLRAGRLFGEVVPGWSGVNHIALERDAVRRAALGDQVRYALGRIPADSPFRARWTGRTPAVVREAIGWAGRASFRLAMTASVWAAGWRIRGSIARMIPADDPSPGR